MTQTGFACRNNTIRLVTGRYLDLKDPQVDQFDIVDIAAGLSKICRFGGQCQRFYSVAEHLVWAHYVAFQDGRDLATRRAIFMHDAAEGLGLVDVPKPLKDMLPEYRVIEARMMAAVATKYDIDFDTTKAVVDEIDHALLIAERRQLFSPDKVIWTGQNQVRRLQIPFRCWKPIEAEAEFLEVAYSLQLYPMPAQPQQA